LEAVQLLQEAHIYTLPPLSFLRSCFIWGLMCCCFFAVSTRLSFAAAASSTIVIVLALANHYTYCPHTRFAGQKNNLYNGKG
uniref:hypothetical protein n=1 Tax=Gemmiger formicilis TaxID=745368 RepID=UPI00402557D2